MTAYISDTDGKLATTSNETGGTKIFAILTRTTPLTITDDTNAIDIQFSVNQALQPEINGLDGNGVYTIAGFWEGLFFQSLLLVNKSHFWFFRQDMLGIKSNV